MALRETNWFLRISWEDPGTQEVLVGILGVGMEILEGQNSFGMNPLSLPTCSWGVVATEGRGSIILISGHEKQFGSRTHQLWTGRSAQSAQGLASHGSTWKSIDPRRVNEMDSFQSH